MTRSSMKHAWILPLFFSVSVFAQRNDNKQKQPQTGGQQRQPTPARNNPQPTQNNNTNNSNRGNAGAGNNGGVRNNNTGSNNRVNIPARSGPGTFRTPSNGGNPVRVAYKGAPRYTSGVPAYGRRVTQLNSSYRTIAYSGRNYRYNNGVFYSPVGSVFQVVFPPIGIQINVLPLGYRRIYVGPNPYYYYNGVFYNNYQTNEYIVVDPPLGAKLPELPSGAKLVTINGQNYYELDGTYYVEEYNINNEVLYTVVGVHGVLNDAYLNTPQVQTNAISTLPPNCRKVNINGQVLYLSPDSVYYQEILDANGTISYQVVGSVAN